MQQHVVAPQGTNNCHYADFPTLKLFDKPDRDVNIQLTAPCP